MSSIAPDTIAAYASTHYHVDVQTPIALEIGIGNPALKALLRQEKTDCCTFITACNPLGEALTDAQNATLQAKLALTLRQRSLVFFDGIGQHPTGAWPGEPSFLVLDLSLASARALGQTLAQNAIVWCGADAVPQLVLLR
ncbi:MAG: hypothetical protein ACI8WM_000303 [Burkholderiaceae bacterium]